MGSLVCGFLQIREWWGGGDGTPLQVSCLENPVDGGAWWAAVHVVARSQTWLSDFTFTFHFHALEKEMATHSSVLAWRIPGTGEPGGLSSLGSHRVGHDWSDLVGGGWVWRLTCVCCLWGSVLGLLTDYLITSSQKTCQVATVSLTL